MEHHINHTFKQGNWSEEVFAYLTKLIPIQSGIAAFDFDNTLIKNDFGEAVMYSLLEHQLPFLREDFSDFFEDKEQSYQIHSSRNENPLRLKEFVLQEYMNLLKNKSTEEAYRWSSFIFSGSNAKDLIDYSRKVWETEKKSSEKSSVKIFPDMLELIEFLKMHNWKIFIVTASPEIIIREFATDFGINPNNIIGMNLEFQHSHLTSKIIEPYTYGLGKVQALQSRFSVLPDLAFGDSENDFPLLCSAIKMGIALEKGDTEFIQKCKKKNFLIQKHFF